MKKDLKISGFKTPEKYFEDFEEQLFSRIEEENLPKSTGFKVPEGYFTHLEDRIIATQIASKKERKVIPLFPKKYFGYAAAIAASLVIGFMVFKPNENKSTLDTIQLSLIDKYIDEGNLNMDLYDLTSYLESRDMPVVNLDNQYFLEATLENYLLENAEEQILMEE